MDLRRFLDLYVSESEEHQRLLHRSLLALERGEDGALDEAFRAAHTLKGLSAAMGYARVADLAHGLEDRLATVRGTAGAPAADLIDELLATADALEAAVAESIRNAPTESGDPDHAAVASAATLPALPAEMPAGTGAIALVRLRPDAPIKAARAMLILRALGAAATGSAPPSFDDDFPGNFYIFFAASTDLTAATAAIQAAGDVAGVELVRTDDGVPAAARPQPRAARAVRVDGGRLDGVAECIGELTLLFGRLRVQHDLPAELGDLVARMGSVLGDLEHDALALRMVPVRESFDRLPRVVRDAARMAGREVDLTLTGEDVELDRAILEEMMEPLVHLLRNAVDHGIEAPAARMAAGKPVRGTVEVRAERERSSVRISVRDDGAGVQAERIVAKAKATGLLPVDAREEVTAEELFRLMSQPGLSTAERVSGLSGRGVGMDVVADRIRGLGGAIELNTVPGQGTTFHIRLPITLALAQALRVRVGGEEYAIPLTHLTEAVDLADNVFVDAQQEWLRVRSGRIPLLRMRQLLSVSADGAEDTAVITDVGGRRAALAFDELLGREQILIKSFDAVQGMLPYFAGATLLADGRPALVLDPLSVL